MRPLTTAYLDAGARLVTHALDHDVASTDRHPLLAWLSQPALITEVQRQIDDGTLPPDLHAPSQGSFRDRWEFHHLYIRDFVTWIRLKSQRTTFPAEVADEIRDAFDSTDRASDLIRRIGRANLESLLESPHFRTQLVLTAISGSHQNRAAVPDFYSHVEERWLPILRKVLGRYELELRTGVEERDVLDILTAIGEGLALRELAEPSSGDVRGRRSTLQSTAALALLLACTADVDISLDQAVDELIDQRRSDQLRG
jgi:hypothetical protein